VEIAKSRNHIGKINLKVKYLPSD